MAIKIKEPRTFTVEIEDSTGDRWKVELTPISKALALELTKKVEKNPQEFALFEGIIKENLISIKSSQIEAEELSDDDKQKLLEILPAEVITGINLAALKAWNDSIEKFTHAKKNSPQPSS